MAGPAVVNPLHQRKAVIAKLGMDAHWRGAIVIANALRDAGMEVVYLGHVTAEELAAAVAQEDPVLVGLSTLSGNHMTEIPAVLSALETAGVSDVAVVAGGAIAPSESRDLMAMGVAAVFPTGSPLAGILDDLGAVVEEVERRQAASG